jgi:hypothetical protein
MMIDFSILAGKVRGDVFELEMGKVSLFKYPVMYFTISVHAH